MNKAKWYVYVLSCKGNTLYTGITNNLEKRITAHSSGNGAKYTRAHLPVTLVYQEEHPDKSSAAKRESEIKNWPRTKKISDLKLSIATN